MAVPVVVVVAATASTVGRQARSSVELIDMRKALPLFVAVLLFASAGTAVAQVRATGSIQGVVIGEDGTSLPGAQVAVTGSKVMG